MNSRLTLTLGGLLLVALTLAGCGGSYNSPTAPTPSPTPGPTPGGTADLTITITGEDGAQSFAPDPATVAVGQTVAFFNADTLVHTATADAGAFNTGNIAPGATSVPITVTAAGNFGYHCAIHPDMVGSLIVTGQ